jgi:hypothetical protein
MGRSVSANVLPFGKKPPPFERRRRDRLTAPNIRTHPSGDQLEILDMSQRGMSIKTSHPFSVGGNYLFELFDQGRSLMVEGRICWCKRTESLPDPANGATETAFRTGIEFVGIQHRTLDTSLEDLSRLPIPLPEPEEDDEQLTADRILRLEHSATADEAAELLLELLSADFEHLVLFRLRDDEIRAWLGRGPTLVPDRLMKLRLRLDQASIFLHLSQGGSFFYGMLPAMFAHLQLLRCWNGSLERECVLFPIRIRKRLVAFLYADIGDRSLAPEHLASLKTASDLFTQALVRQILRRKSGSSEEPT